MRSLIACCSIAVLASCVLSRAPSYTPAASTAAEPADRADGFVSERRWGTRGADHWEPVVAADRSSTWIYQMTTGQRPDFLLFRASPDSGTTWSHTRHICRRGTRVPFQYDPQLAVGGDGTIDAVCLNGFRPGVVFTQSRDRGRTWTRSVALDGPRHYSDKPTLAVSSGKDVYVAFNSYYALYVAASHDGGATWQTPVKATTEHRWYYSYGGTVAPNGSVWFAVDGEGGRNEIGNGHIELVGSSDGGVTWRTVAFGYTHEGAPCHVRHCYPDFFTGQDAVAVDSAGNYVFVFAQNAFKQGPNALYASRSRDGVSWSTPTVVNALGNNASPALVAGPTPGDFRLVWQDNRNGPSAWNTWYAQSSDAGKHWTREVRLSNRRSGAPYKHSAGYEFPFGDYLGLDVDGRGRAYAIWGEGSAVYHPGGTWWTRQ